MKALKIILIILAVIVLVVGGCSYWVYRNIDGFIVSAIESTGSDVLQTSVNVDDVNFSLSQARTELHGFEIENYPGFDQPNLFALNQIAVDFDPNSVESGVLIFDEVLIDGVTLTLEQQASGNTNIQELKKRLDALSSGQQSEEQVEADGEQPKFIIRQLKFTNVKTEVYSPLIENQSYQMQDVIRRDLGVESGGVTGAELAGEVFQPFIDQVEDLLRDKAGEEINQLLKDNLSDEDAENLDQLNKLLNQ
ncbi:AsmA family protein [Gilvimarinus agarilyticus]|uniref:AsmA family protein n=1 Tax=unclassified Gilvimarinus TaxID=2642066 RepID=UPI001C080FA7|nr:MULTISPECIES: AsmA family protein [unclassified Gilvimarinus]MBU2886994.1 AsmA family protein [Gilvimarinus agarilyticus]MDO6571654.1 AsmA family protein [Gilvimarinus sp. 2_MG-2023]MDO6745726.1 AsmA family protein [Gilvimarinus sp. 1_MG-2023]